jgi:hypothetical protein
MLENYLVSLTKRQSMLLLTAVTFGGQDSLGSLDFLPDAEAEILKHRAREILAMPRERRIPLLVQEMQRLVKPRRGQLWATGPEQLAQLLLRERGVTRQVLLRALPSGLADSVRRCLPPDRRPNGREVRTEVLDILRGKLEDILVRATPEGASFKFADVLLLQPREMLTLLDALGTRALAPALAGLTSDEQETFVAGLPPGLRASVDDAMILARVRRLRAEDAREALQAHAGGTGADSVRSAGTQRMARALLAQSTDFALRVLERQTPEVRAVLSRWLKEERSRAVNRGDGGRLDVVAELERLAQHSMVDRPLRPAQAIAGALNGASAGLPPPGFAPQRPPLLPPPRAQAALRMAQGALGNAPKGVASSKPAPRSSPPSSEPTREPLREPSRKSPGGAEARRVPGKQTAGKPGGRGPNGRSG